MKRLRDLVTFHPDGSVEFKVSITIRSQTGGISIGPGIRLKRGVSFMGLDYDWILAHLDDVVN